MLGNRVDLFAANAPHGQTRQAIVITGGGSDIGAGLAAAFHRRRAGRRYPIHDCLLMARLKSIVARHPGLELAAVDLADAGQVVASIANRGFTMLINNTGIHTAFDCTGPKPPNAAAPAREVDIDLRRLIQVTDAFLPVLRRQPRARLAHVGSK